MESKVKTALFTIGYKKSNLQKNYIISQYKLIVLKNALLNKHVLSFCLKSLGASRSNAYGKTVPKPYPHGNFCEALWGAQKNSRLFRRKC